MQTSCTAHGKVILIGEHSVVYGYDALAMPIKALHITTSVEETAGTTWMDTALYHGPFFEAPDDSNGLKYVVRELCKRAGKEIPVKLTYTGEIPIERGLGSSATVALGTTKALSQFLGLKLTEQDIMDITNHAETINHGKASGLDAASVNSESLVFFSKQAGPQAKTFFQLCARPEAMPTASCSAIPHSTNCSGSWSAKSFSVTEPRASVVTAIISLSCFASSSKVSVKLFLQAIIVLKCVLKVLNSFVNLLQSLLILSLVRHSVVPLRNVLHI